MSSRSLTISVTFVTTAVLFLFAFRSAEETVPFNPIPQVAISPRPPLKPMTLEGSPELVSEVFQSDMPETVSADSSEGWREPTYSSYRYDPTLSDDPDYRTLVAHHLFLESFYNSPVRFEESFQTLLDLVTRWGLDPEQELELVVHANNMAFEYQSRHRNYRRATGNVAPERDYRVEKSRLKFNVNNLKERFAFLFEGYPEAKFEDLIRLTPSANFPSFSLKIEPGTRLISK